MKNLKINPKNIQLIIYDFDGIMTNNKVLVFQDGREAVFCNRSDGLAVSRIKKMGIPQLILSTEKNNVVKVRARKIGIPALNAVNNKENTIKKYCKIKNINFKNVVYLGNDINDLEAMKLVGYPIAPSDASKEIKKIAKIITRAKGGEGVIRELLEKLKI